MSEQLEKVLEQSFLDYSAYVIQRRAIPDARDMMKYTARQILHAQYKDKLDAKHPFKKSQKSVAGATSFSYVHGDASCYEQIIRMGRPLVQRYFFEEINGNGGTPMNSTDYSAPRYTEARLSPLCSQLFNQIGSNTVSETDWEPTYDEEGVFPKVLPSLGYYNICNGSFGSIAPTMISSIPQFNLRDINAGIVALIKDPKATINILPDFASGGILLNPLTTADSLVKGEGKSALLRGKVKRGPGYLEVMELPYGVYTNTVCSELDKAIESGDCPITEFKDLSKRTVNMRLYAKDLDKAEAWLYKNTSVQKHFTIKMIMLDGGKTPKLFSLKEALLAHIGHINIVWRRALEFQLQQLKNREEVINGLLRAYSILDDVIATIKGSKGRVDAIAQLISAFEFAQLQAEAIVDLRLHKLSTIDIQSLKDELESNLNSQAEIEETLDIKEKFDLQLIAMYEKTASEFGDKRRTEIYDGVMFETGQDTGKSTGDIFISLGTNGYTAVTGDEINDDGPIKRFLNLKVGQEMIIITNQMRGFIRASSDFPLGENTWDKVIKLNPGEVPIVFTSKEDLEQIEFVEFTTDAGDTYSVHNSFILVAASKRGKKIVSGKYNVTSFRFAEKSTTFPKMK